MPDRSIRNITVRHKHPHQTEHVEQPAPRRRRRGGSRIWIVALVVLVVAALLGVLLSAIFSGASVTITPRTAAVTMPVAIQAGLNAPVGTLSYQQATVSLSATTTVPANGTQQVSRAASGVLTISNSFSAAPQKLIANTRFQAPDGKIYRIHDSITVPGMQGTTPGTATVTAFADSPGPDYNRSGTTAYTIPGFKGDPRFAKITALSGAMTGGFIGAQPAVAQADLTKAQTAMEQQLDTAVRQAFVQNMPAGYQVIHGSLLVTYGDLSQTDAGNNQANLSESASVTGNIVRTSDLAAAVAKQTVQGYSGEAIAFADPSTINPQASSTPNATSLNIYLGGGQTTLVWQVDPGALQAALLGKQKSQFEAIIKQFEPAVAKADASIRPFWTTTFPQDPKLITVTVADVK